MTEYGKAIVDNILTHPAEWVQEDCTFEHKYLGTSIWTSNLPFFDLVLYRPFEMSFTWSDKWHIFWAIRKHRQLYLTQLWSNDDT